MNRLTRRDLLKGASLAALAAGCSSEPEAPTAQAPSTPPNILLLFPDQLRFDWIGLHGSVPVRTPHLDKLAARGVRFTNAVVPSPLCAPCRAALASGKEYDNCRVPSNAADFPLDQTTFYQQLRKAGYHVMGCGKFDLHKATELWGEDGQRLLSEWGFTGGIDNAGKWDAIRSGSETPKDPYMGHLHATQRVKTHVDDFNHRRAMASYTYTDPTPLPDDSYCDNWIGENGIGLLRSAPQGRPWFLQVNYTGPHDPLDITESMVPLYANQSDFPQANRNTQHPAELHIKMRRNYSAMVENIDRWTGRFIEELAKRGELENTLIVFSSDHGEMLGDHDRWGKTLPYQASAGVPLVACGPGVREGVVSNALISIMDLAATFLDYGQGEIPSDMDSRSIRPLLEGKTETHREIVLSGLGTWRFAWDGRYKLVRGFDENPAPRDSSAPAPSYADMQRFTLLFDLDEDPLENVNLAEKAPDTVKRLEEALPSPA